MKFYDVVRRKPCKIPDQEVKYKKIRTKHGTIKMATAIGPAGNKLYKIVAREA